LILNVYIVYTEKVGHQSVKQLKPIGLITTSLERFKIREAQTNVAISKARVFRAPSIFLFGLNLVLKRLVESKILRKSHIFDF
jgi:hypothetical protein